MAVEFPWEDPRRKVDTIFGAKERDADDLLRAAYDKAFARGGVGIGYRAQQQAAEDAKFKRLADAQIAALQQSQRPSEYYIGEFTRNSIIGCFSSTDPNKVLLLCPL